ncbi:hypothetical protein [Actinokineospora terrae]|uniref:Uncharacterized protein n=1 Tax=Actinokineospora terrae TaxID=155974 RepID=A0A1H9XDN3_9PSEU|nr:hypothetical protein [Actinokineospora terrae]SES44141.1 hypothetical protein SAMN04487818_114103 [Actinokineospora terrae]
MGTEVRPSVVGELVVAAAAGRSETVGGGGDWSTRVEELHPASAWRMSVVERLQRLQAEIDQRPADVPQAVHVAMRIAARAVELKSSPARWYSGVNIERAWRAVHLADEVLVASSPDLPSRMPAIRATVTRKLPERDPRARALAPAAFDVLGDAARRDVVLVALRGMHQASHDAATAVRSLRNRIILFGLLLLAINLAVGWLTALHDHMLPLCLGTGADAICPTGTGTPTGGDVWWLQLMGMLGASIAVVVLLLRTKPSVVPYTLTPYQAVVKVLLGAILAVVGVLILRTGLLHDLVGNQAALLIFALVLGYSQQLGTRLLDSFADQVVQRAQPSATTT